jgi:hypothetical protein
MAESEGLPSITKEKLLAHIKEEFNNDSADFSPVIHYVECIHGEQKRDSGSLYLEEHIYPVALNVINLLQNSILQRKL